MARNRRVHTASQVSSPVRSAPLMEGLECRKLLAADITGQFTLPADSGFAPGAEIVALVSVRNDGDTNFDGALEGRIYLSTDSVLDEGDVQIGTVSGNLKIAAGRAYKAKPLADIPADTALGTYRLILDFDPENTIAESNEGNNVIVSDPIMIAAPDLTAALGDYKGAASIVAGQAAKSSVKVTVANAGGLATPKGAKVNVKIFARPADAVDASQDVEVGAADVAVSSLKAGASAKAKSINLAFPANLPADSYELVAVVDPTGLITESNENNNTATLAGTEIDVAAPFVDLSAIINNAKLPDAVIAGDGAKIQLPLEVTNNGNVPLDAGQTVDIQVFARPAAAVDDSQDVSIGTIASQSLSKLKAGGVKKLKLNVLLPAELAENDYVLVAKVDSGLDVNESNENNNTAQTPGDDAIAVADAFVDLGIEAASTTFAGSVVGGTDAKGTVLLKNNGNVNAAGKVDIKFFAIVGDTETEIGSLNDVTVSLKPGASKAFNVNLSAPEVNDETTYQIVARISGFESFTDEDAGNNELNADTLTVTEAPTFLQIFGDTITFTQTNNVGGGTTQGTWIDSKGNTGQYNYVALVTGFPAADKLGTIDIFATGQQFPRVTAIVTFKARPANLNGVTLLFAASGANDGTAMITIQPDVVNVEQVNGVVDIV